MLALLHRLHPSKATGGCFHVALEFLFPARGDRLPSVATRRSSNPLQQYEMVARVATPSRMRFGPEDPFYVRASQWGNWVAPAQVRRAVGGHSFRLFALTAWGRLDGRSLFGEGRNFVTTEGYPTFVWCMARTTRGAFFRRRGGRCGFDGREPFSARACT